LAEIKIPVNLQKQYLFDAFPNFLALMGNLGPTS
jgi:hypothetical protein